MKVSVVIPSLNEEAFIEQTLGSVQVQTQPWEIIVADGGSIDATRQLAAVHASMIEAPRGRARQMNAGAARATGDVLLFLHADTLLPFDALDVIRTSLADPHVEAGVFRLRFDTETPLLRFYSLCTRLPWPLLAFGDRALFVRRRVFDELSGFQSIPIYEDLEFVRRLHQRGGFRFLPQFVVSSARRFLSAGPMRQQMLNLYLWLGFLFGVPPPRMAPLYPYDEQS